MDNRRPAAVAAEETTRQTVAELCRLEEPFAPVLVRDGPVAVRVGMRFNQLALFWIRETSDGSY